MLLINLQEENLAAEAELARQEEEKKLQAQKLESVSNLICSSLVVRICTCIRMYIIMYMKMYFKPGVGGVHLVS